MENPLPPEAEPLPEKRGRLLIAAGAILGFMIVGALGVYAWYAVYGPCTRGTVNAASSALFEQVAAFEQAYQAAASTTPVGLMGPLTNMQQILWNTRDVTVPACMQNARNELLTSMESAIRAFLAIMTGESKQAVEELLQDSQTHLDTFSTELEAVNRCAPFCLLNSADKSPLAASSVRMAEARPETWAEDLVRTTGSLTIEP